LQTKAEDATDKLQGVNRRAYPRHAPIERAAMWFNTGAAKGETCELKDVSMSGFAISCDEWQLPLFLATEGHTLYCVLLLGEAHFGCMARMVETDGKHSGRLGFHFEAVPDSSMRLLQGLIDCMAERQSRDTDSPI